MRFKKKVIATLTVFVLTLFLAQSVFATLSRSSWPTLQQGDSGGFVSALQADLWASGLSSTVGTIDGSFGTATKNAVKAFQTANSLTSDGSAGPATHAKFNTYVYTIDAYEKYYSNPASTTYDNYYQLSPDGAGGSVYTYYLQYRSNGYVVNYGVYNYIP